MALVLNEEQQMLRDSAQAFLTGNAPVAHLRKLRDGGDPTGFSLDIWRRFAELGFTGALVPEDHGGVGLGVVEAGVIAQELGRTLTPSPFVSTAVLAARALVRAGSDAQKQRWLPGIAAGELIAALALDESSKHRPFELDTAARRDGDGFVLDGAKTFVVDGHVAQLLIVSARTAPAGAQGDGITLFLVDPGAEGVAVERTSMVDSHNAARVRMSGVRVGPDAVLGGLGQGGVLLEEILDVGRAVVAAQLMGSADEVFARTLAYLKERKQFDRFIGEFQALQHRMATLYCDIELAHSLVLHALQALDADPAEARAAVSAAKALACKTADLAVREGVQMHGGMGMTDEFDIGLFMKRVRVGQELLGDANFHADRYAALGGY
jgi:acyl-CoA dehydrogenase